VKTILIIINLNNCKTENNRGLINLYGVQRSFIEKNSFTNCNEGKTLIQYEDMVRSVHFLRKNSLSKSGVVLTDKFVQTEN
jgi:hypothetical protein